METKIDYLDKVINIICGCTAGCSYCWARNRYAPRFAHNCKKCGTFEPHFHEERLKQIARIKKGIIGLNFMGDTWDKNVNREWWKKILWNVIAKNNGNNPSQFIVLTKQPQNIIQDNFIVKDKTLDGELNDVLHYPCNLWVGVSIENIDHIDRWIALSQKEYIQHKIISFEPVLDKKSESNVKSLEWYFDTYGWPEWIIIGALTKSDKESMARSRFQSESLLSYLLKIKDRSPVFVKDNCQLKGAPKEFPALLRPNQVKQ